MTSVRTQKALARFAALQLLASIPMRHFTKQDWDAFAGCEDPMPAIGTSDDYTLVLDGKTLLVLHNADEHGGETFTLTDDEIETATAPGDARQAERSAYGRPV